MKKLVILCLAGVVLAGLITGCGSSRKVERVAADTVIDLSGKWNDTDSRLVSEEMVGDCLSRPWITDFAAAEGNKPVVTVGPIRNLSEEHINVATFAKKFERELVNSGQVKFVASKIERLDVRDERMDQQSHASDATAARLGEETGADYMLQGMVTSITDQIEGRRVIYYQTDFELIHIETNEKVWMGSKQIKKDITQKGKKW